MFSKKKKKPAISLPSNFQHRVHTGYDNSSNKFVGLPKQWASLVEDVAGSSSPRRPQPVIDPSTITPTDMLDLKVEIKPHPQKECHDGKLQLELNVILFFRVLQSFRIS